MLLCKPIGYRLQSLVVGKKKKSLNSIQVLNGSSNPIEILVSSCLIGVKSSKIKP